jgi:hypothetical protein
MWMRDTSGERREGGSMLMNKHRNAKFEARNPKQAQMSKQKHGKYKYRGVWDFYIRILDLFWPATSSAESI